LEWVDAAIRFNKKAMANIKIKICIAGVRGKPWHETDRATHLVEKTSVDLNGEDIDTYIMYKGTKGPSEYNKIQTRRTETPI
jgi:hypothetical protein